jgi:peptide/nickel transport system substrate-binding protein
MEGPKFIRILTLISAIGLLTLLAVSCGGSAPPVAEVATEVPAAPVVDTPVVADKAPAEVKSQAPIARAASTLAPLPVAQPTEAPLAPGAVARMPEGTLTLSEFDFSTESWLPWEETNQQFYWERVMEQLLMLDPITWEFLPGLAKEWEVSPDGHTVTWKLQEGIQFHEDYGEFTSEDAVFTLNQWLFHETSTHPAVAAMIQADPEVRAIDKYTVEIEFRSSPYLTALMDASSGNNGVGMMSKAYVDEVGFDLARRKGIGTGPYRFIEHKLGESITLEAVEGEHWRIVPQWRDLKIMVTIEPSTRLAQVLSDEVDIALLPGSFKRMAESSGVRTILNPGVAGVFIVPVVYIPGTFGIDAPNPDNPLANPLVREAFSLAINRQEIADVVFSGGAVPTGLTDLSPISLGYDERWEEPDPFDLDRAKQLFEETGISGQTFKFGQRSLGGIPEAPQLAEAIAGMWEAAGLDIDLSLNLQSSQHSSSRRSRALEGELWMMRLGHLTDTTRRIMSQLRCTQEKTALFTCNEELELLSPKIAASINLEEKDKLMHRAYELILDERTIIPVVQTASLYAIGPRVGGWTPRLGERFTTEIEKVGHAK